MPLIIALSGHHNSGKTTLGTFLVRELRKRGYRVSVVKATKEEGLLTDKPGSDTFKYREAGAEGVCLLQRDLLTLYFQDFPQDRGEFLAFLENLFWSMDLILLEGFKGFEGIPKIWLLKEGEIPDELKGRYPDIELLIQPEEKERALSFVLQKLEASPKEEVKLSVNGRELPMKPFIKTMLREILQGFLKGLKGLPEEIAYLEVKIKEK